MRLVFVCFLLCLIQSAAGQDQPNVGDIAFDPVLDDPQFQLCNPSRVAQGYELKSPRDDTRRTINKKLRQQFVYMQEWSTVSGFVRVRFVVNCFGLTDRFRLLTLSEDLEETPFPPDITLHLRNLVKGIQWPIGHFNMNTVDYYHHVTFKIKSGKLEQVIL